MTTSYPQDNQKADPPHQPDVDQRLPPYAAAPAHVTQQQQQQQQQPQPQALLAATGPHVLHVYHEGMIHRRTQILDSDKHTVLYHVKHNRRFLFSSEPDMTIYADASGNVVGTVSFQSLSRAMDLVVHNQPIQLIPCGLFTSSYEFSRPSTGGTMAKWKRDGIFSLDILCLDENEKILARFDYSTWAVSKVGKFEIGPAVANRGRSVDEIIVSGLAMVEVEKRRRNAA